jgi:four helix bundle protein
VAIRTYHDLDVFREAYAAALDVSRLAKRFPVVEQYELARQMRRAARSIPANIVEGWGKRASTLEFKRYLQIAIGSCDEARMWLDLSSDEGYISESDCTKAKDR